MRIYKAGEADMPQTTKGKVFIQKGETGMYKEFSFKGKRYRIDLTHYVEFIGGAVYAAIIIFMFTR